MIRSAIIDGDIIAYKAAEAAQTAVEWENDVWSVWCNADKAFDAAVSQVERIANNLKATKLVLAFTDDVNFRKAVMSSYKAKRGPKPVGLKAVKLKLAEKFTTYTKPGLEGDDVLGILATHPTLLPGERIIVSEDKDLKTIPGYHYNPRTEAFTNIGELEADYWHLFQTLTGDTTDGYPGCKGIGPVKAAEILKKGHLEGEEWNIPRMWGNVVEAYLKAKFTEEDALQNARVARICRVKDYDMRTGTVHLWDPPK